MHFGIRNVGCFLLYARVEGINVINKRLGGARVDSKANGDDAEHSIIRVEHLISVKQLRQPVYPLAALRTSLVYSVTGPACTNRYARTSHRKQDRTTCRVDFACGCDVERKIEISLYRERPEKNEMVVK